MDAVGHGPVEAERQRLAGDRAVGVDERVVRELEPRREELDRRRAEEDRAAPVDPQVVARDEPRVAGEEAVVPRRGSRPSGWQTRTRSSRLMVIVDGPTWTGKVIGRVGPLASAESRWMRSSTRPRHASSSSVSAQSSATSDPRGRVRRRSRTRGMLGRDAGRERIREGRRTSSRSPSTGRPRAAAMTSPAAMAFTSVGVSSSWGPWASRSAASIGRDAVLLELVDPVRRVVVVERRRAPSSHRCLRRPS